MQVARVLAIASAIGALVSACAEPPVKPIPDATRRTITSISGDVSGLKHSDTSQIGARGSNEGAQRGAAQGAGTMASSGSLLGLLLMPVGAAVGGAKGAAEAQSEDTVDATRAEMRLAMQDTDFGEELRSQLASSKVDGEIVISSMTSGSSTAAQQSVNATGSGAPAHVIAIEYRLAIFHQAHVNPRIALIAQVTAQVQSPDRKQMLHKATWTYCGEPQNFVQMGANKAALLRSQINTAATVLAEAIPYDLFVSKQPRPLKGACMDFTDLPSGKGTKAPALLS
jgi:hypothetical protein